MKAKYIKHYKNKIKVMDNWFHFVLTFKFKNNEVFISILEAIPYYGVQKENI